MISRGSSSVDRSEVVQHVAERCLAGGTDAVDAPVLLALQEVLARRIQRRRRGGADAWRRVAREVIGCLPSAVVTVAAGESARAKSAGGDGRWQRRAGTRLDEIADEARGTAVGMTRFDGRPPARLAERAQAWVVGIDAGASAARKARAAIGHARVLPIGTTFIADITVFGVHRAMRSAEIVLWVRRASAEPVRTLEYLLRTSLIEEQAVALRLGLSPADDRLDDILAVRNRVRVATLAACLDRTEAARKLHREFAALLGGSRDAAERKGEAEQRDAVEVASPMTMHSHLQSPAVQPGCRRESGAM